MKAERRHELKENSLVRGARNFPDFWKQYGSKLTLGIILVALVVVLVMRWRQSREEGRRAIAQDLTQARTDLAWLQQNAVNPYVAAAQQGESARDIARLFQMEGFRQQMGMPGRSVAELEQSLGSLRGGESAVMARQAVWANVEKAVNKVLAESSSPSEVAEAKLLRADANLYWAFLASLGDVPEATTRPDLKIAGRRDDFLKTAEANFQEVAGQAGSLSPLQAGSAGLGLAAVAEARGKAADAIKIYDDLEQKNGDKLVKELAANRKAALAAAEKAGAKLLGPARDKAAEDADREKWLAQTRPSTAPAAGGTTQPAGAATQPATAAQPATQPAVPATQPTAPATQPTAPAAQPATQPAAAPPTAPAATTRPTTGQG
ncbi:MAG TPA: hypothetical protein VF796_24140 [Humisphaera sp.]